MSTYDGDDAARASATYIYLRWIAILPAAWLLAAIILDALHRGTWFDSISDYYGGPVRDTFVGALMACGVCMIAYKGRSRLEDYALNFAGVNAFLVALVPNSFQSLLDHAESDPRAIAVEVVTRSELLWSLRSGVVLFLALVAVFVVIDRVKMSGTWFHVKDQAPEAVKLTVAFVVSELGLLALVVTMIFVETIFGASLFTVVHFAAAVLLVLNLSCAAASNAFARLQSRPAALVGQAPANSQDGEDLANDHDESSVQEQDELAIHRRRTSFKGITFAMLAGLVVGGIWIAWQVATDREGVAILVTEMVEIALFIVFWVRATSEELVLPRA